MIMIECIPEVKYEIDLSICHNNIILVIIISYTSYINGSWEQSIYS